MARRRDSRLSALFVYVKQAAVLQLMMQLSPAADYLGAG
jgi:hypothetical protein